MKQLVVKKIGKLKWVLNNDFEIFGWTVPKGFETDLATVVRTWARDADEAAVLHDYLLSVGHNRRFCDEEFYRAMISIQVHPIKAKIMYYGVRLYSIGIGIRCYLFK
jgi:hypothetical protein